jgi:hypothetical protein
MKNVVFWDVAPCRSCLNRRFGETYRLPLQGRIIRERGTSLSRWLQIAAETSVHTGSTRRHIPEDGILQISFSTLKRFFLILIVFVFRTWVIFIMKTCRCNHDMKKPYDLKRNCTGHTRRVSLFVTKSVRNNFCPNKFSEIRAETYVGLHV